MEPMEPGGRPALALRRRVFAILRDNEAVDILFEQLAPKFADRPGGYTRVVRMPEVRLGDAGAQAMIEFVGDDRDRVKSGRRTGPAPVVSEEPAAQAPATETQEPAPETSAETESAQETPEGEDKAE